MPVFVNSLVITAEVSGSPAPSPAPGSPRPAGATLAAAGDQDRLAEEITAAVMRRVELALDRLNER
jgi:hypothetical protein